MRAVEVRASDRAVAGPVDVPGAHCQRPGAPRAGDEALLHPRAVEVGACDPAVGPLDVCGVDRHLGWNPACGQLAAWEVGPGPLRPVSATNRR